MTLVKLTILDYVYIQLFLFMSRTHTRYS